MYVTNEKVSVLEKATILQRASWSVVESTQGGQITASKFCQVYKWVNNTGKTPQC